MKASSRLYLFFTSLLFLFPPLALGLASIYFAVSYDTVHFPGLMINIGLIVILGLIMFLLIERRQLKFPSFNDRKFLLFGILSNIVIFFYTFQQSLDIERLMTIYLIMIVILFLYFIIINKKPIIKELWILSIWFLLVDTLHYRYWYVGEYGQMWDYTSATPLLVIFYSTIPLLGLGLYVYEIKKYKIIDIFSIISIGLVSLTLLLFGDVVVMNSEFIMTINLIIPFVIITDFVTMLIYKRFNPLKVAFYIRLYTIMVFIFIYSEQQYFSSSTFSSKELYEMVGIIYAAIVCNLIVYLIPKKEVKGDPLSESISEVSEVIPKIKSSETLLSIDLNTLTFATLKAIAKAKRIENYTNLTKEEIIELLK